MVGNSHVQNTSALVNQENNLSDRQQWHFHMPEESAYASKPPWWVTSHHGVCQRISSSPSTVARISSLAAGLPHWCFVYWASNISPFKTCEWKSLLLSYPLWGHLWPHVRSCVLHYRRYSHRPTSHDCCEDNRKEPDMLPQAHWKKDGISM